MESHDALVAALRAIGGLHDVGRGQPNFHFRSRPFLHFHVGEHGVYADVRLGGRDVRRVPASTPAERQALLEQVHRHVTRVERTRKAARDRR